MHIFHKWEVVYEWSLPNKHGGFQHLKCSKCGKEGISDWLTLFSSTWGEAARVGVEAGIYMGHRPNLDFL